MYKRQPEKKYPLRGSFFFLPAFGRYCAFGAPLPPGSPLRPTRCPTHDSGSTLRLSTYSFSTRHPNMVGALFLFGERWVTRTYIAALDFKKNRNGCYGAPILIMCICTRESKLTATQLPFQRRKKKPPKNSRCSLYPTRRETNCSNSHNLIELYEI